MKRYYFIIEGREFKGTNVNGIISALEACGYQAQREEQNPHAYWQLAEHLKREQDGKKNPKSVDNPRRQYPKREVKNGENISGNIQNSAKDKKFHRQQGKEIGTIEGNNGPSEKVKAPYCGKRRNYKKPDRD